MPIDATPESLLAEHDFVRALARSLLRGHAADADDLAQDVWVTAQRRAKPGDGVRDVRGWLGRVTRNLARDRRKLGARRQRHELAVAESRAAGFAPSTTRVLEFEELRRSVVDAVLALDEPQRGVMLQHYWEGSSAAQIAARLGVPDATVRSWLHRGRERVRQRLASRDSDRSGYSALLALAGLPVRDGAAVGAGSAGTVAFSIGALWMSAKGKLVGSVLLAVCFGLVWWSVAAPSTGGPRGTPSDVLPPIAHGDLEAPDRATSGVVTAPDASELRRDAVAAAADQDFVLTGVVEWNGAPYAAALLLEEQPGIGETTGEAVRLAEVRSRASDGTFGWRGPVREIARTLRVRSPDPKLRVYMSSVPLLALAREARLKISAIPLLCEVRGVVRDGRDGAPIAGARILPNGVKSHAVDTDADGAFCLWHGVGSDSKPLVVGARGFAERILPLELPANARTWSVDVTLHPGDVIRGRVVAADGTPIAGAQIDTSIGTIFDVASDADGHFEVAGVEIGSSVAVYAQQRGFVRAQAVWDGDVEPVQLVLRPGHRVRGTVLSRSAQGLAPVPLVRVTMRSGRPGGMQGRARSAISDADGGFVFEDTAPGAVEVTADAPGFVKAFAAVEVDPDQRDATTTLELHAGCAVRGRVIDADGEPVAGASVYAEFLPSSEKSTRARTPRAVGSRDESDADGRFELSDLPRRTPVTIHAFVVGHERASAVDVIAEHAPAELELRVVRAPGVAGRVVDAVGGEPLARFEVVAWPADMQRGFWVEPQSFESADGVFEFRPRQLAEVDAMLRVEVRADGYAPQTMEAKALRAPPPGQLVFQLQRGVTLRGVVRDATDRHQPIVGVVARLLQPGDDPQLLADEAARTASTDADGRFVFEAVGTGEVRILLQHPDYADAIHGPVAVGTGPGELAVETELSHGVRVAGRLLGFELGAGEVRVNVYHRELSRSRGTCQVAADGRFVFEGMSVGPHHAFVRGLPGGETRIVHFDVGTRDVDGIEVRATEGSGRLTCVTPGLDGGEAQLISLAEGPRAAQPATRWVDYRGGNFQFAGLAPGRYRVRVESSDGAIQREQVVEVGADTSTELELR